MKEQDERTVMASPRLAFAPRASWRAEQRTLRQGQVALVLGTAAGPVADLTIAHPEVTRA
jgi:hypothetical protein